MAVLCVPSSWCRRLAWCLQLLYFLVMLTYFLNYMYTQMLKKVTKLTPTATERITTSPSGPLDSRCSLLSRDGIQCSHSELRINSDNDGWVDLPLIGNTGLKFGTGQPHSYCAKFCSCCAFRSILAAVLRQKQCYSKLFARLSCDLRETFFKENWKQP